MDENFLQKAIGKLNELSESLSKIPVGCIVNKKMWNRLMELPDKPTVSGMSSFKFDTKWSSFETSFFEGMLVYLDEDQNETYKMYYNNDELMEKLKQISERKRK